LLCTPNITVAPNSLDLPDDMFFAPINMEALYISHNGMAHPHEGRYARHSCPTGFCAAPVMRRFGHLRTFGARPYEVPTVQPCLQIRHQLRDLFPIEVRPRVERRIRWKRHRLPRLTRDQPFWACIIGTKPDSRTPRLLITCERTLLKRTGRTIYVVELYDLKTTARFTDLHLSAPFKFQSGQTFA
jgi:hypothetical protein